MINMSRKSFDEMSVLERHNRLMSVHRGNCFKATTKVTGTDLSGLKTAHRFIREGTDTDDTSWEEKLAIRYYSRLYREFAICDLSRFKEQQVGFRWRVEKEVLEGKGQFTCGAKGCLSSMGLECFEVNFSYREAGEKKSALVKVKLCGSCAVKLNYGRGEKSFRYLGSQSSGKRGREESEEGQSSKAQKVVEAAEILVLALGQKSQGGEEQGWRPQQINIGIEPPLSADAKVVEDSSKVTSMTADEGVWSKSLKLCDDALIHKDEEGIDSYLDQMFQ